MLIQDQKSMKTKIATFLFLLINLGLSATDLIDKKLYNYYTFKQIEVSTPWLQSDNAAGLSLIPDLFPADLKLGFNLSNGDYHSVFQGETMQNYYLSSRSFRKINKTYIYGSFNYRKGLEKGLNFSNLNNPSMNYPYLLADTIGNDTYDREFFTLEGIISSPLTNQLEWGMKFNYEVGVAAQNRDPRPENKVLKLNVSPGLLYKSGNYKVGVNLNYEYYNEDIDISVIEKNVQYTIFQLHGLGTSTYHASTSFYRLYQQHQLGGGLQLDYSAGSFSNLLHSNLDYLRQTIDDGRAAGTANWSYIKNDALMEGINWNLTDIASFVHGRKTHQVKTSLQIDSRLGTEFIQRLEKVGETDLERWLTYGKEQKYYSVRTEASMFYQLMGKNESGQMNSLLDAGVKYSAFEEKYYLPNLDQHYSNLLFSITYLKMVALPKAVISVEVSFRYQLNLKGEQNIDFTKPLAQKILIPEFNYLNDDYLSPGIALSYQIPLKKIFNKYFIKSDFDWYHSSGHDRTMFSFSTGIIF